MASDRRAEPRRDPDGVRTTGSNARWSLVPVLAGLVVVGWLLLPGATQPPAPPTGEVAPPAAPPSAAPTPAAARDATPSASRLDPEVAQQREYARQARREAREERRRARHEPTYTLNGPGQNDGISAFPPPGTKPVKRGIVVPDGVELPPGYVRHYQTTDDGRPLPPVLMFHPDYQPVDADGVPIPLPADRIVPPDMAPPGLRGHTLDETADAGPRGRSVDAPAPPDAAGR